MARRRFRAFPGRRRARIVHQMRPVSLTAGLTSVSSPVDGTHPRVLGAGDIAFRKIVDRVNQAKTSLEIRAFLWRDDDAGNMLGQAVLAAAQRGVTITIHKDRIAAVYEYTGGNKQSFFHKRVDPCGAFKLGFVDGDASARFV